MLLLKSNRETAQKVSKNIKISQIRRNPYQPRTVFDDGGISELAESVRLYGIINPLIVRRAAQGYELIAGERRLRAAMVCGMTEVPCIVICADERESSLIALVENLQRRDLDFFEEAHGFRRLVDQFGLTQEEAARRVGKTQSAVANKLRLLKLPDEVMQRIREAGLSERHARALLRLEGEVQRRALEEIIRRGLNVSASEEYIESLLTPKKEARAARPFPVIRDVRLFLNTVNRAVDTMRRSGVSAECEREQEGESIVLKIRIASAVKNA